MTALQALAAASAASRRAGPAGEEPALQCLTFMLDDNLFAIGILAIREIIEYGSLTEVPMTPPFIRGVINLRGAAVPVVDLAVRFGRPARQVGRRTCIVIVEVESPSGSREMGIVVDSVSEVLDIPAADIEAPPEFGTAIPTDFMAGMGKVAGRFVVILAIDRVLSFEEVVACLGEPELAGVD